MWRVTRKHLIYGEGFKDFATLEEAEAWINSDESQDDLENGFFFKIEKIN